MKDMRNATRSFCFGFLEHIEMIDHMEIFKQNYVIYVPQESAGWAFKHPGADQIFI